METRTHPVEVVTIYEKILKQSSAESRYIEIGGGRKIHLVEAGAGPPLVILHGGGAAAHTNIPLLPHLEGVRVVMPDRPGYGLSDPVDVGSAGYRTMAVSVTDQILDAVGLDQVSLAGSSGGGVWAIWYALAHPERVERLILLGGAPLLPGTRAPLPLRLITTPIIGDIIGRIPVNESAFIRFMGMMGEAETIVHYPQMIEALVAGSNDPVASKTNRTELSALLNFRGFKPKMKTRADDLAQLRMPVLVIWGEHDPLGGEDAARTLCEAIPDCVLALLPTGHVPWLGHPKRTAKLILDFVLSS